MAPLRRSRRRVSLGHFVAIAVALHVLGLWGGSRWLWVGWQVAAVTEERPAPMDEVDVAWVELPEVNPDLDLPDPAEEARLPMPVEPARREKPLIDPASDERVPEPDPERPPDRSKAAVPKPQKPPELPKPDLAKPKEVAPLPVPKAIPLRDKHRMVEVDDEEHVVEEPNLHAEYWSDKNRRVTEESHDTRTNLVKASKGEESASAEHPDRDSLLVGGPDEKIAGLDDARATSLAAKAREVRPEPQARESGDEGHEGRPGERGPRGKLAELRMRDPEPLPGLGAGRKPAPATEPPGKVGQPGRAGAPGKKGKRGPKLRLEHDDYRRIVGDEQAQHEDQEIARRQKSHHKGRWEQKLARIHSALENFTPEVRPGNQTALGTRAHPFAVYIARMHRRIHELWAFGFIDTLNTKASANPLNDPLLAVTMEIALGPEGSVDKVTIVRSSGLLPFDVAAVDTVLSAGPYEATPRDIRSANDKVYTHWTFHRDDRLCGTFFADPFILDNPHEPAHQDAVPSLEEGIARQRQSRRAPPVQLSREKGSATEGGVRVPHVARPGTGDAAAAARVNNNLPTPDAPGANEVARLFVGAFETGDTRALLALAATPFRAAGTVVAEDTAGVVAVIRTLFSEVPERTIEEWKLFSAAGYRGAFGNLPPGAEDGTATLYLVLQTRSEQLTFEVVEKDEQYRIVGLHR